MTLLARNNRNALCELTGIPSLNMTNNFCSTITNYPTENQTQSINKLPFSFINLFIRAEHLISYLALYYLFIKIGKLILSFVADLSFNYLYHKKKELKMRK